MRRNTDKVLALVELDVFGPGIHAQQHSPSLHSLIIIIIIILILIIDNLHYVLSRHPCLGRV